MAVSKNDTRVTQSGVVIRNDAGLGGMLGFTQYSGLVYAIAQDDAQGVLNWLDRKQEHPSAQIYISTLGMGWSIPQLKPVYPIPQLLPDTRSWSVVPSPDKPILVNWFITGRCPLACKYCYAEDLMRKEDLEPTAAQISETAETILSLSPVVVVLTGGDPLFAQLVVEHGHAAKQTVAEILLGYQFVGRDLLRLDVWIGGPGPGAGGVGIFILAGSAERLPVQQLHGGLLGGLPDQCRSRRESSESMLARRDNGRSSSLVKANIYRCGSLGEEPVVRNQESGVRGQAS